MKFISTGESIFIFEQELYFLNKNKYYKWNGKCITEISKKEYFANKFGKNYEKIICQIGKDIDFYNIKRDPVSEYVVVSSYQEDNVKLFNELGENIFKLDKTVVPFCGIYDAIFFENNIWILYPTWNVVICYSLKNESIIKNYDENTGLNFPENVCINNNNVYISNMGGKNILKISENGQIEEYMKFDEEIWEFSYSNGRKFVRLQNGIYEL